MEFPYLCKTCVLDAFPLRKERQRLVHRKCARGQRNNMANIRGVKSVRSFRWEAAFSITYIERNAENCHVLIRVVREVETSRHWLKAFVSLILILRRSRSPILPPFRWCMFFLPFINSTFHYYSLIHSNEGLWLETSVFESWTLLTWGWLVIYFGVSLSHRPSFFWNKIPFAFKSLGPVVRSTVSADHWLN